MDIDRCRFILRAPDTLQADGQCCERGMLLAERSKGEADPGRSITWRTLGKYPAVWIKLGWSLPFPIIHEACTFPNSRPVLYLIYDKCSICHLHKYDNRDILFANPFTVSVARGSQCRISQHAAPLKLRIKDFVQGPTDMWLLCRGRGLTQRSSSHEHRNLVS